MKAAALLLLLCACAPRPETCTTVLPMTVPVRLEQVGAAYRCAGVDEDVLVVATLRRAGVAWERDELFVDGSRVAPEDFTRALSAAKERHRVRAEQARQRAQVRALRENLRAATTRARDRLRRLLP